MPAGDPPLRLILLGKPGSGKGTQAKRIAAYEGIPQISTGDLIRATIASGSELGKKFKSFTDRGNLVPDDLVLNMVDERLAKPDTKHGFLLDGFPRTVPQAEALEKYLATRALPLSAAVNIAVPDEVLVERAEGRRFCPRDGSSYHVKFAPPKASGKCDTCGSDLLQRDDDKEKVVRVRLREYAAKTAPLIDFYSSRGQLQEVDGVGAPDEVEQRIEAVLEGLR
jgi:adenylate kinase